MNENTVSAALKGVAILFALLGPKFFHSDHGQKTLSEVETALVAGSQVADAVDPKSAQGSAAK